MKTTHTHPNAAGTFSFPVAFGIHWVHRIDSQIAIKELFDGRPVAGLNRDCQRRECLDFLLPRLPAGCCVLNAKLHDDAAPVVQDDHVVVISGPIETREMTDRWLLVHGFLWFELATRRGGSTTGRTGTVSFMSCCSIRPLGGSRRAGRCSNFSLLEACAIGPCRARGVAAIGRSRRWKFTHLCASRIGKVIHNWRPEAWAGGPASRQLLNNFGTGTSAIH